MPLEAGNTIQDLVESNPISDDGTTQGDDHLRLLKVVLKNIFPGVAAQGFAIPITASEDELNFSVGVTSPIQTQIDDEVAARIADVDAEEAARILAVDTETNARIAADIVIQDDVDANEIASDNADATLQTNIDTLTQDTSDGFDAVLVTTNALDARIDILEARDLPTGTRMLFSQAAAPTGWTQDAAQDDRMIRLVSGAGNGIGGSDSPISLTQNMSHIHTTPSHTLTTNEIPAHTHNTIGNGSNSPGVANVTFWSASDSGPRAILSEATGGGASHAHGATGNGNLANISFAMRYQNVIVCSKDA